MAATLKKLFIFPLGKLKNRAKVLRKFETLYSQVGQNFLSTMLEIFVDADQLNNLRLLISSCLRRREKIVMQK